MAAEGGNIVRFTYTGAEGEWIPDEATHILVLARVIRREAFLRHPNIVEVICDENVEEIEEAAFWLCRRLRRVIMRGVKIVEEDAFFKCRALEHLECDKLEIIGHSAFCCCTSLRSINLPSTRIVRKMALWECKSLTNVKFGSKLERIFMYAFVACESLERIAIPLKDGLITADNTFRGCHNLRQVDLVEGELHETVASLHLEEWRNDTKKEIDLINQILPNAWASDLDQRDDDGGDPGEKAQAIRRWIRSVLDKIIQYQEKHQRFLEQDVATTLQLVLSNSDIVMNNVLPFLELPPYTFDVGGDDEDEDTDSSDDVE